MHRTRPRRRWCGIIVLPSLLLLATAGPAAAQAAGTPDVSLDSLLNTHVSTAAKYAQTMIAAPASITIITADDIARYGWRNLDDVFATVRGLYMSNDRNYPYLGIRGFSRPTDYNNRVLFLINGHTFNENMYGSAPAGSDLVMDLASVERIEIVRGQGSALYGTSAMLAIVNVVTRSAQDTDAWRVSVLGSPPNEARASARLAHVFTRTGTAVTIDGLVDRNPGGNLYFKEYDSSATNHGVAQGVDWENRHSAFATVTQGGFSASGFTNWRDKGIPTGSFGTIFNDPRAHTMDVNKFAELKYASPSTLARQLTVRTYWDAYDYHGGYPADFGLEVERVSVYALGAEAFVRADLASNNRLIVGGEYRDVPRARYQDLVDGVEAYSRSSAFSISSAYAQDEFQLSRRVTVFGGVRRDSYSIGEGSTSPRAALVWSPSNETTVKAMYGEAFRVPSIAEADLFQVGYKPNPSLAPEHIRTIEANLYQRLGSDWLATLSAYDFDIRDLIDPVVDPVDSLIQNRNVGRVTVNGAELELSARLPAGISGYASAAWQHAHDEDTNQRMPNSPNVLAKAGVSQRIGAWIWGVEGHYESGRLTIGGTETRGGAIFDGNVRWRLGSRVLGARTECSLFVRNLLNTLFEVPAGVEHRQTVLPMPSRAISLQLTVRP